MSEKLILGLLIAFISLMLVASSVGQKRSEDDKEKSVACFRAVEKLPEAARTSAFATCAALELEKK